MAFERWVLPHGTIFDYAEATENTLRDGGSPVTKVELGAMLTCLENQIGVTEFGRGGLSNWRVEALAFGLEREGRYLGKLLGNRAVERS